MKRYFYIGISKCGSFQPLDERDTNGRVVTLAIGKLVLEWWVTWG